RDQRLSGAAARRAGKWRGRILRRFARTHWRVGSLPSGERMNIQRIFARPPLDAGQCVFGWISPQKRVIVHSSFKRALNSVIVSSAIVKHTQEGKIIGSEQT